MHHHAARAGLPLLFLLLLLAGCAAGTQQGGAGAEATADETPEVVRQAVAITQEIEADPDAADQILARHGLTVEQFEEMMYEISSDPALSRAYNAQID